MSLQSKPLGDTEFIRFKLRICFNHLQAWLAVWPDVKMKCCPKFRKVAQKEPHQFLHEKLKPFLQWTLKFLNIWATFVIKIGFQELSKIAQSGHTDIDSVEFLVHRRILGNGDQMLVRKWSVSTTSPKLPNFACLYFDQNRRLVRKGLLP